MEKESNTQVGLKRLRSASVLASNAHTQAERIYKSARALTPTFLEPSLAKVEDTVSAMAAPAVAKAQDAGDKLLLFADSKVDIALTTADQMYSNTKTNVSQSLSSVLAIHQSNMKTFSEASEKYFQYLTSTADWVVDKLNPVKGVQAARDTLNAALKTAKEASDPDVAVQMAQDAWSKFSSIPAVSKLLTTAEPVTKLGCSTFSKFHDAVVVSNLYKSTLETAMSALGWASATTPYRMSAYYLYPWVQPVADPALETVGKSQVVNQVVDYWKPVKAV